MKSLNDEDRSADLLCMKDAYITVRQTDYTYDASGNRTAASGSATVTATYNGAGEATSYENSSANMSAVTYGDGLRTAATSTPTGGSASTQHFVWNTTTSVPSLLMDSANAYIYGPSGTPFEQVNLSSGTIKYLDSDALGSVRGIVSATGSLSSSTSYDAYSNPETTGGLSSDTPFGFASGFTDPTGLLYLVNRYYDPITGQFISVDPMVRNTGQPYAYTGGDPVNGADPSDKDYNATLSASAAKILGELLIQGGNLGAIASQLPLPGPIADIAAGILISISAYGPDLVETANQAEQKARRSGRHIPQVVVVQVDVIT